MNDPPQNFAIIPEAAALSRLQRDLRFVPSDVQAPKTLTRQQVEDFNHHGFLKQLRVFPENEMQEHRAYFESLLADVIKGGGDSYSISSAHLHHAHVFDLLTNEHIVACVQDLLGNDVIGWGAHFFCKMPRDGKSVAWHQDASYWPLTPSKTVTVWLAIDRARRENACMRFIPGSHLHGHIGFRTSLDEEKNVLDQTVENAESYGASPIDVELDAGEISIHSDLLLHGSEANHSDRRRCGLTLRYCSADVTAHLDWNLKGVVVSGAADPERWPGASRPPESC